VQDPFSQDNRPRKRSNILLRIDSWIDSSLWSAGFGLGEVWEEITIFFRRFRVRGPARALVEVVGEGMTLGTAGAVLMLALALPAFEETQGNWQAHDDYAVTFLDRYGAEIGHRGIIHEDSVPVDQLPDHLIKAVLGTEDRRFFEHFGIDFFGLVRAMGENARAGSVVQGGSTITQQLAKNMFLSNERTVERKIKEAFLALWLEANLSKNDILRLYLDRAYMGGGTFGAAAAAQFYFGKPVTEVDLAESAMLAGLFKAPARYAPHVNLPAARARANQVLTNMVQGGLMTEGQVVAARRNPASVVDRGSREAPDYFLDWAFEEVQRIAGRFPRYPLNGASFRVSQGAVVLMEHGGAIRAMVGGRDYGESQFNRATKALRQPGSSFKGFVYATAMENGFTPQSIVSDGPITWNGWSPRNYTRGFAGRVDLTSALARSLNTVPVRLARDHLGTEAIAETARRFGVQTPVRTDKTMPLGTSEITVLDMATGYGVFPAGGYETNRHGITQILNHRGDVLYDHARDNPAPQRVLSEQADIYMNTMLAQIPEWGTARRAKLDGIRTAGKTGTSQSYRDAWFIGYTGNYTAAVWFGNDDFTPMNNMTGGSLPAMTFKRLMDYAHQGIELRAIPGVEPEAPSATAPVVAAAEGAEGLTPLQRPRALSKESTVLLRAIADSFANATAFTPRGELAAAPATPASVSQ
jgi:penicillin-binding protein 1A